jgi:hypothetical protein
VRVLLDENLPHDLIVLPTGHSVSTVQGLRWSGIKNGDLLKRAGGMTDALVTMDGNIEHQQDVSGLPFGVVVVHARLESRPRSGAAGLGHSRRTGEGWTWEGRARWSVRANSAGLEKT